MAMKKLSWSKITAASLLTCSAMGAIPVGGMEKSQVLPKGQTVYPLTSKQRTGIGYSTYILGSGDGLDIELVDLPELSGRFTIGPDGTLYLPRLRALYVEGLTVEELQNFLIEQFRTYVIDPQVYIRPVAYRPIRVYIGGEVKRPGYYTLSGLQTPGENLTKTPSNLVDKGSIQEVSLANLADAGSSTTLFPTVFDAIRTAQGITPYSNLSKVQVTRRQAMSRGGGRLRTQLNFLSLITKGDESQNIRLFDGDVVNVGKSHGAARTATQAGQTNLTPQFLQVYVTTGLSRPVPLPCPRLKSGAGGGSGRWHQGASRQSGIHPLHPRRRDRPAHLRL